MLNFFKGVIVGMGGIAPGLSGSVLLVIFGLYQRTVDAIGNVFRDFKKNLFFLIPPHPFRRHPPPRTAPRSAPP